MGEGERVGRVKKKRVGWNGRKRGKRMIWIWKTGE
jgi:hypothetical protein